MAANKARGEVELVVSREVDGKPDTKRLTLRLTMNAAAELETRHPGKGVLQLVMAATQGHFTSLRDVVWLLLQKHHAKEFPDPATVGEFIDEWGGFEAFLGALGDTVTANKPPEGDKAAGDAANPPGAQVGPTGAASTSTPGASV